MEYQRDELLMFKEVKIQSQSMDISFLIEAFKSVLEYSLLLGCIYGVLMLLVELHEII
ncbi:hypothetical protein [Alkaliphilus transvaalensis]|uniref:hypothetical protein n=1 Tax=Alkaliphilus transvaalensis TaxID=114628 RepID=UPI0012EC0EE5|nr:hypothetical protein [Alkaliphilus transvaalensis]